MSADAPRKRRSALSSGERRLPACSARLLAAHIPRRATRSRRNIFRAVARASKASCLRQQAGSLRSPEKKITRDAFTIIELLVVMSIVIVLAGLILATSGYVQKKGARSRAEAEIAAMSAALESYKADNGVYPREATTTDQLDPTGAIPNSSSYVAASLKLYQTLSGDTDNDRKIDDKNYFNFKPNQLSPSDQASAVTAIRDPFGNSYGYSTMKASDPTKNGFNPTFDLWSTAGTASAGATDQAQWIKNW